MPRRGGTTTRRRGGGGGGGCSSASASASASADFRQARARVGKRKPVSDAVRHGNPSFATRTLVVPAQSSLLAPAKHAHTRLPPEASARADSAAPSPPVPLSHRRLAFPELLVRLSHHNDTARRDALLGLLELCRAHPTEILGDASRGHVAPLLRACLGLSRDDAPAVRAALFALLRFVLAHLGEARVAPFAPLLIAHAIASLTHPFAAVRRDALAFADLLWKLAPGPARRCCRGRERVAEFLRAFAALLSAREDPRIRRSHRAASLVSLDAFLRVLDVDPPAAGAAHDPAAAPAAAAQLSRCCWEWDAAWVSAERPGPLAALLRHPGASAGTHADGKEAEEAEAEEAEAEEQPGGYSGAAWAVASSSSSAAASSAAADRSATSLNPAEEALLRVLDCWTEFAHFSAGESGSAAVLVPQVARRLLERFPSLAASPAVLRRLDAVLLAPFPFVADSAREEEEDAQGVAAVNIEICRLLELLLARSAAPRLPSDSVLEWIADTLGAEELPLPLVSRVLPLALPRVRDALARGPPPHPLAERVLNAFFRFESRCEARTLAKRRCVAFALGLLEFPSSRPGAAVVGGGGDGGGDGGDSLRRCCLLLLAKVLWELQASEPVQTSGVLLGLAALARRRAVCTDALQPALVPFFAPVNRTTGARMPGPFVLLPADVQEHALWCVASLGQLEDALLTALCRGLCDPRVGDGNAAAAVDLLRGVLAPAPLASLVLTLGLARGPREDPLAPVIAAALRRAAAEGAPSLLPSLRAALHRVAEDRASPLSRVRRAEALDAAFAGAVAVVSFPEAL